MPTPTHEVTPCATLTKRHMRVTKQGDEEGGCHSSRGSSLLSAPTHHNPNTCRLLGRRKARLGSSMVANKAGWSSVQL